MKRLLVFMLVIYGTHLDAQITDVRVGLDIGIRQDFNTYEYNDNNYFLTSQHDWIGRGFLLGQTYFNFNATATWLENYVLELGVARHWIVDYSEFYVPELDLSNSSESSSPYTKWNIGIGKRINIYKRFHVVPSLQVSYIRTDDDIDERLGGGMSKDSLYIFTRESIARSNSHFFIGAKLIFQWKFNDYLDLNLSIGYNQGLQDSYQLDYELVLTDEPEKTYSGRSVSKLSHSMLGIGFQYKIWKKNES